jgi:DNA-binding CsgD family transcriptional regulator
MSSRDLTESESSVSLEVARGRTNAQSARDLGIAVSTVKSILGVAMTK